MQVHGTQQCAPSINVIFTLCELDRLDSTIQLRKATDSTSSCFVASVLGSVQPVPESQLRASEISKIVFSRFSSDSQHAEEKR